MTFDWSGTACCYSERKVIPKAAKACLPWNAECVWSMGEQSGDGIRGLMQTYQAGKKGDPACGGTLLSEVDVPTATLWIKAGIVYEPTSELWHLFAYVFNNAGTGIEEVLAWYTTATKPCAQAVSDWENQLVTANYSCGDSLLGTSLEAAILLAFPDDTNNGVVGRLDDGAISTTPCCCYCLCCMSSMTDDIEVTWSVSNFGCATCPGVYVPSGTKTLVKTESAGGAFWSLVYEAEETCNDGLGNPQTVTVNIGLTWNCEAGYWTFGVTAAGPGLTTSGFTSRLFPGATSDAACPDALALSSEVLPLFTTQGTCFNDGGTSEVTLSATFGTSYCCSGRTCIEGTPGATYGACDEGI